MIRLYAKLNLAAREAVTFAYEVGFRNIEQELGVAIMVAFIHNANDHNSYWSCLHLLASDCSQHFF